MAKYCSKCGSELEDNNRFCSKCGNEVDKNTNTNAYQETNGNQPKSKIAAGILGILLGSLGIHNFYLGYTSK